MISFGVKTPVPVIATLCMVKNPFRVSIGIARKWSSVTGVLAMRDQGAVEIDLFRGNGLAGLPFNYIDNVCTFEGDNNDGEWFIFDGSATNIAGTVTGNLVIPSDGAGATSGSLATRVGGATSTFLLTVNNNTSAITAAGTNEPIICQTEGTAVVAGTFVSDQNNLVANSGASRSGYMAYDPSETAVNDDCYTTADYNGSFGITGDQYRPTDAKFLNSPPGANDIVADPQFVDDSLTFTTWMAGVDAGLTTWDLWWAEAKKMNNDTGYNPDVHWMQFHAAARAAFTPTNETYRGAGFDGSDTGAVPMSAASGGIGVIGQVVGDVIKPIIGNIIN